MQRFSLKALFFNVLVAAAVGGVLTALLWTNEAVPRWALALLWLPLALFVVFRMRRYIRRLLKGSEPPPGVRRVLEEKVRFYERLDEAGKARFRRAVHYFLLDQNIVGVDTKVDDEVRALVAASAVVLSFGLPEYEWDTTRDILIYSNAFDENYDIGTGKGRLGQVGSQGPVIFSVQALRAGFARGTDGHNVGLHEFAHVLDFDDGEIDGIPANLDWQSIRPWVDQMSGLMEKADKQGHRARVLRTYGYTNQAEFFACATEMFFEQPQALQRKAPELYEIMKGFYRQDPLAGA